MNDGALALAEGIVFGILLVLLGAQPMLPHEGLIAAGKTYPGAQVCDSEENEALMIMAQTHAAYMARVCQQGHQGFQERFDGIRAATGLSAAEICAESWPWQTEEPPEALGREMFKCWAQSPGHWRVAAASHRFYGAGMAKGRNGIWYACILVAD